MHGLALFPLSMFRLHASRRSPIGAAGVLGLALLFATSGCLSDRYTIPDDEVRRQLQLPPEQRGQGMHVVQNIGDRAEEPVPYGAQPAPPPGYGPTDYAPQGYGPQGQSNAHVGVFVGINLAPGPRYAPAPAPPPVVRTAAPTRNPREGMPVGRGGSSAGSGGTTNPGGGGFRGGNSPGGGSSRNNSGDAKALAVILVAAAIGATVGAAATEGARYDGRAVVAPNHNVYLKRTDGGEMVQRLDALQAQDLVGITDVEVSDAEGYGLLRVGRDPLNRQGFTFKLDGGSMGTRLFDGATARGAGANIQFGYFFTKNLGLLATSVLTGGLDSAGDDFFRSQIGGEVQGFLPGLGPLHLGAYGNLAAFNTGLGNNATSGTAWGAGGLLEIELTTRLALDLRVGGSWSKSSVNGTGADGLGVTMGLAIY